MNEPICESASLGLDIAHVEDRRHMCHKMAFEGSVYKRMWSAPPFKKIASSMNRWCSSIGKVRLVYA
jgi:hypothetical protein